MNGSGTIQVLKRDGTAEPFDSLKLSNAIWKAIGAEPKAYERACYLGDAVMFYLSRSGSACCSSAAIFEMCVRILQYVGYGRGAERWQQHRSWRMRRRRGLRVCHEGEHVTLWDKSWLAEFARQSWHLSQRTARILAGQVETMLLAGEAETLDRQAVIEQLNELVAAYGLADAVPARQV